MKSISPVITTEILGERLRQSRLNCNLTQLDLAELAGVSRKTVLNAEKGKVQLSSLVAIMIALGLEDNFNSFLPEQPISPIQLAKLQGHRRQRASGTKTNKEKRNAAW